jgi:hypothetical protein
MIYFVDMSGSGKSYWTTNYIEEYLKKFKKIKFILYLQYLTIRILYNPNIQTFLDDPQVQVDGNLMLYLPRLAVLVRIEADRPGAWFPGPLGPYQAWFPAI